MKNRNLLTEGNGYFFETTYKRPKLKSGEIAVKSLLTGICRSDVDMMVGKFPPLPASMMGHEGLGQVIEVDKDVVDVKVGDYVATCGEPAFADSYNVALHKYVKVPNASPKYILEPVACGINLILHSFDVIKKKNGGRFLILGSGFLSNIVYQSLMLLSFDFEVDVVGFQNKEIWDNVLTDKTSGRYDVIVDVSSRPTVFQEDICNDTALVIMGSSKTVNTNFEKFLWKSCDMSFPSPRSPAFYSSLKTAAQWVKNGDLKDIDYFWSHRFNRNTMWNKAFNDSLHRTGDFRRAYLFWE